MATHVPMARVPFAPLDNPRLQHLANAKNRQNGISALASDITGKSSLSSKTTTKRDYGSTFFEDADFDSENVDPASLTSPSKKSKNSNGFDKPVKPFAFTFSPSVKPTVQSSMAPPPTVPARLSTPVRANLSSLRTPLTAPAGRSPKRKTALGGISKPRRTSAPFTRIDPPSFTSSSSAMPLSLDAALSGMLDSSSASTSTSILKTAPTSSTKAKEAMPKGWFFEIYEDTAEEEAANLMEHSTLTLDLSSDDESNVKARSDRGKENIAPEGYDASSASRPAPASAAAAGAEVTSVLADAVGNSSAGVAAETAAANDVAAAIDAVVSGKKAMKAVDLPRKRKLHVDAMDDGLRAPLSELETESLDVVDGKSTDSKGEIVVWED